MSGSQREQLRGRLQTGAARHRDVQHRQVDLQLARELDRLQPVAGLGDDLEIRLGIEHQTQASAHHHVIVGEQHPGGGHGRPASRSRTDVPSPTALCTSSSAPISRARSRIPSKPVLSDVAPGSKPAPSSRHLELDPPIADVESELRGPRRRVPDDVRQGLLRHPIDHELLVGVQPGQRRRDPALHLQARSDASCRWSGPPARSAGRGRRAPPVAGAERSHAPPPSWCARSREPPRRRPIPCRVRRGRAAGSPR